MTAQVNALFARWIAAAPDQWLCVKRRWPRPRAKPAGRRQGLDDLPTPVSRRGRRLSRGGSTAEAGSSARSR